MSMPSNEHLQHIAQGGKPTTEPKHEAILTKGVWLRTTIPNDASPSRTVHIEVLVETLKGWQLVIDDTYTPGDGPISHIVEPGGIAIAPLDVVTADSART